MFEGIVSKYQEEVSRFGDVAMMMVYVICAVIALNVFLIAVVVLRTLVNHIQTLQHKFVCCCVALTLPASASLVLFKHFKRLENEWRDISAGEGGEQNNLDVSKATHPHARWWRLLLDSLAAVSRGLNIMIIAP
jgi:hypothetical protein